MGACRRALCTTSRVIIVKVRRTLRGSGRSAQTVSLPTQAERFRMSSAARPSPAHILVVEDDEDCRECLKYYLEKEGLGVSCAANGREALDRLRTEPLPNLILL